jgi:hypothetical protein
MLAPETRVMLTDTLRPPDGYRVDIAVATTYSLDLTALLLAPLSFALFDQADDKDFTAVDPIRLLEAVRRHSEHTTVFCQAGAIAVPAAYRSILTFVEECVREVMPPTRDRVFHPKIWALRFVNQSGEHRHRFICLSRNLTFDRSWDTALRLDEEPEAEQAIDTNPLSDFLSALPGLSTRPLEAPRRSQIESLASSMRDARLVPPAPFVSATFVPLGLGQDQWPFPVQADKLLAISPFLDKTSLQRLGSVAHDKILVSRAETLDRVGGNAVLDWETQTLQRLVEVEVGDDVEESPTAIDEWQRIPEGLHAKTFILDVGDQALVVTGSANLTGAAWGGNVEFDVAMTGPLNACGVLATLDGTPDAPGLSRMLEDYKPTNAEGVDDAAQETSWALELFHQQLAASRPELHVTRLDEDRVALQLQMDVPANPPGATLVWPVSLPRDTHGVGLVGAPEWAAISPRHVTPFIGVETTAGDGDARSTRRCVIEASLHGDVDQRRRDAVAEVLRSKDDVLRYLVFLLGDPSYAALLEQMTGAGEDAFSGWGAIGARHDVALFEPLVRATGRDTDALARVASLVSDLKQLPNGDELVPEGFGDLWDVVWQVHQETQP